MRFRIDLHATRKPWLLPLDYQYALASAVYKIIARGDVEYSRFLHDEGFSPGGLRRFKLFTFSALHLPRYTPHPTLGAFELLSPTLSFSVSFMADKAAEAFVKGMFQDQRFSLGNNRFQLDLEVVSVEAMAPPFFQPVMHYRTASPMVVEAHEPGKKYETYLPPDDPRFEGLLLQNLISKCAALNLLHPSEKFAEQSMAFQLRGAYRSKKHTLKPGQESETHVRGFLFDFTLTAPEYMQEMGYYAGFGMNNAMGFGCVSVLN